jgi:hypothetical protein
MLGHGNPRFRVIQKDSIEAGLKLHQIRYSMQYVRIKEKG